MVDFNNFRLWLAENTSYTRKTIGNTVSRFKRADSILPWRDEKVYFFELEQNPEYLSLKGDVKSQIKKALNLYAEYYHSQQELKVIGSGDNMKALSLFANIGVAEAYLKELGIDVVLANEFVERRAILYSKIYPHTHMICGDIMNEKIFQEILGEAIANNVDIIMATPPCQGMSTAGPQQLDDERNKLIIPVIRMIKVIKPKYVFLENVPLFYNTSIKIDDKEILIKELIDQELNGDYIIHKNVIDTKYYSVPQTRERAVVLMTKKGENREWIIPQKDEKIVTMQDAIGDIPCLDPFISDVNEDELLKIFPHFKERKETAKKISHWHNPPHHIKRQVIAMQHTPTGCTAFDNPIYYPIKENGDAVKGYRNTYKRQNWDTPAYTVTMDNRKISSQNNVHPGRLEYIDENGDNIYSDARTLTLYELMKVMSIPENWPVPKDTSEAFLRRIIGEGIPPLFVKKVFEMIV